MKKFKVFNHDHVYVVKAAYKSEGYDQLTFIDDKRNIVAQFRDWDRWCEITEFDCITEEK